MTDAQQREAARQFYYRWNGKDKEDEDARSYWIEILTDIFGMENVTQRIYCIIKIPKVADKNGEKCISILEKVAANNQQIQGNSASIGGAKSKMLKNPLQTFTQTRILVMSTRTITTRRKGEC